MRYLTVFPFHVAMMQTRRNLRQATADEIPARHYGHATAEAECSFHITALLILPYTARCWVELPYWQMEVVSTMSD